MAQPDSRGTQILEMPVRTGLIVFNTNSTPTIRRPVCGGTIPHVTTMGWGTGRFHSQRSSVQFLFPTRPVNIDVEKFVKTLLRVVNQRQEPGPDRKTAAESLVRLTMSLIIAAYNASVPKRKFRPRKLPLHWWTDV